MTQCRGIIGENVKVIPSKENNLFGVCDEGRKSRIVMKRGEHRVLRHAC